MLKVENIISLWRFVIPNRYLSPEISGGGDG